MRLARWWPSDAIIGLEALHASVAVPNLDIEVIQQLGSQPDRFVVVHAGYAKRRTADVIAAPKSENLVFAHAYLSAVETEENVVLSFVPTPLSTVMIATAMPAAIKPYSMAVAAESSRRKSLNFFIGEG